MLQPFPKSKRGARRQYFAILRQCYRDGRGGLTFGMDWPTIRASWPDRYIRMRWIQYNFDSLPD